MFSSSMVSSIVVFVLSFSSLEIGNAEKYALTTASMTVIVGRLLESVWRCLVQWGIPLILEVLKFNEFANPTIHSWNDTLSSQEDYFRVTVQKANSIRV